MQEQQNHVVLSSVSSVRRLGLIATLPIETTLAQVSQLSLTSQFQASDGVMRVLILLCRASAA